MTSALIIRNANEYSKRYLDWRARWVHGARAQQLDPPGEWDTWLLVAGRGYGKTRVGAQWAANKALRKPKQRVAVIGPTQNDVRSVCFEGESGLVAVVPPWFVKSFSTSTLEMELRNGSILVGKSAEKPDRLRGPQWNYGWGDEVSSWGAAAGGVNNEGKRLKETWDNYLFGARLGTHPQTLLTTSPRPLQFLRDLIADERTHTTRGSTFDNAANLAPSALAALKRIYDGTRKGQQELYGEILSENEYALWKLTQLDDLRVKATPHNSFAVRVVVAIDPAVTAGEESDETGIVVAELHDNGNVYVVADYSGKYSPREWARAALLAYERHNADSIVAETNQGGDLVEANIRGEAGGRPVRIKRVHAKRGKYLRAEPIAASYEKGIVHHVGVFSKLESQMCNFVGSTGAGSPDRLDALVYAIGDLTLGTNAHAFW